MKRKLVTIFCDEVENYDGLSDVEELATVEDVATLIETYFEAKRVEDYKRFSKVMQDDEGHFFIIIGGEGTFDIIDFVTTYFENDNCISCMNIKSVYPSALSRGVYEIEEPEEVAKEVNNAPEEEDEDDDDEGATSYMDEEVENGGLVLKRLSTRESVEIPAEGLTVGRSKKQAQYAVLGNKNIGRCHCKLYYLNGVIYVHDFGSLNGTYVNNVRVDTDRDIEVPIGAKLSIADENFEIL